MSEPTQIEIKQAHANHNKVYALVTMEVLASVAMAVSLQQAYVRIVNENAAIAQTLSTMQQKP